MISRAKRAERANSCCCLVPQAIEIYHRVSHSHVMLGVIVLRIHLSFLTRDTPNWVNDKTSLDATPMHAAHVRDHRNNSQ
jgi:hypothetical protein